MIKIKYLLVSIQLKGNNYLLNNFPKQDNILKAYLFNNYIKCAAIWAASFALLKTN